jgi:hypothetical protein
MMFCDSFNYFDDAKVRIIWDSAKKNGKKIKKYCILPIPR